MKRGQEWCWILLFCWIQQTFAQTQLRSSKYSDAYISGKVELWLKEEMRITLEQGGVAALPWPETVRSLNGWNVKLRFPNAQKPRTGAFKERAGDLSLMLSASFDENLAVDEVLSRLSKIKWIKHAEPHFLPELSYVPNDDSVGVQYGLQKIQAFAAWDIHRGDTATIIGITDTGIDPNHPDLSANIARNWADPENGVDDDQDGFIDNFLGWDTGNDDNNPTSDGNFHGQHVTGLSSAVADNTTGMAGSGFNCRFVHVKIANSNGSLTGAYDGLVYCAEKGYKIINCSWGGTQYSPINEEILRYVSVNLDCIVFCGAGNNSNNKPFYPSAYPYAFAVGSTNAEDHKSDFSNFGFFLDAYAPGDLVLSTWANGGYLYSGGTSMASPLVAGCAGILRSAFPNENSRQIGERLKVTADKIDTLPFNLPWQGLMGDGRINIFKALTTTGIPAPVLHEIIASDGNDNQFLPGDTLEIRGLITNYLYGANNVILRDFSVDGFLIPLEAERNLGAIAGMESISLENTPLKFRIAENVPLNQTAVIRFEFEADGVVRSQFYNLSLHADFVNIEHNDIAISVGSSGLFGVRGTGSLRGLGFQYQNLQDLLYEGGLMLGLDESRVADRVRGTPQADNDFQAIWRIHQNAPFEGSSIQYRGLFAGTQPDFPLLIKQRAISDSVAENRNFIILEYQIKNTGSESYSNVAAGLFADWDLIDPGSNATDYSSSERCAYVYTLPVDSVYTGIGLLTAQTPVCHAIDNVPGGAGGINMFDGYSSADKFQSLTNNRFTTGAGANGTDVLSVLSASAISLSPGDSVTVAFSLLAGRSLEELLASAEQSASFYAQQGQVLQVKALVEERVLYPNPTQSNFQIRGNPADKAVLLSLTGQTVAEIYPDEQGVFSINGIQQGLYIIHWVGQKETGYARLQIQH
jgi:serine protease